MTILVGLTWLAPARANPMLLVDMANLEVLYEDDAGQPWHPASLTKLMTAYVAFDAIAAGRISLDETLTMSVKAVSQPPSSSGLRAGSVITVRDALYVMLVQSANDMAWAIAEKVGGTEDNFIAMMNETAHRMGLTATHYENPHGLHDPAQVSSARDLAVLSLYIRQNFPQFLTIFETEKVTLGKASLTTNNNLLTHFAGTTGMKTGFVCSSGLNIVATIERGGRSLMAVVLGGTSARERGEMAAEMVLKALSGELKGGGKSVLSVSNKGGSPTDMRPKLCGKEAKAYVKQREAEFPLGLKGQPSYLTDDVHGLTYAATDLGVILTDIPLPRPRPYHLPSVTTAQLGTTPVIETPVAELSPSGDAAQVSPEVTYPDAPIPQPRPRPGLQS